MTAPESSESSEKAPGKYVQANGLNIYYEEHNQPAGQTLIMIHGGTLTGASWQSYLPGFSDYRVITPDTRGHGRTLNTGETLTFGLLADDMAAFVKELGLEKPVILGYSDGGQTVLEFGMRYPDLAGALIIGGAYPEVTAPSVSWVTSILGPEGSPDFDAEKLEREDPDFIGSIKGEQGADNWQNYLRQMKPLWLQRLNYTPDDFAKVTTPTLLVMADHDDFVTIEEVVTLYRALPKAELAVIPNSDHGALIFSLSRIAMVQPIILNFLKRQPVTV